MNVGERITLLEARLDAMSSTIKTVLTTLVLRGLLTKPAVEAILQECEASLSESPAARQELKSVRDDLPQYLRTAMGPPSDDDDHGH